MNLTNHFTLEELTDSGKARELKIDNTPPPSIVANLRYTAHVLELVRAWLGNNPMSVTSGYRNPAVNRAVGGASNSDHLQGVAADFRCPGYGPPLAVCRRLAASDLPFNQLIYEGTWTHIGIAPPGTLARREVLTAHFANGKATYTRGLPA
ncbi:D-Ala-D-Ala carboxypeptidase family metallohydrolase [Burkholderia contaminans]|uniref:D-Ala-D-Ala carboxypeptidase family metallohydrolase n=1 Tax=Burkholderia contaminans TaxID=488447 RepID=UPI0014543996|nr:D-Ala-D-Ala carboxypeptidase family metallohydrolase [Burkholderia contaminans]VWD22512.1 peptidase M15A [Burkholderia contaminans]